MVLSGDAHTHTHTPSPPRPHAGLAQQGYLEQPAFLAYLEYLCYWRRRPYAGYVIYPLGLEALGLLQTPRFRVQLLSPDAAQVLHAGQFAAYAALDSAKGSLSAMHMPAIAPPGTL